MRRLMLPVLIGAVLSAASGWVYVYDHVSAFISLGPEWLRLTTGIYGGWPVLFLDYGVDLIGGDLNLAPNRWRQIGPPQEASLNPSLLWERFAVNTLVWIGGTAVVAGFVRRRRQTGGST